MLRTSAYVMGRHFATERVALGLSGVLIGTTASFGQKVGARPYEMEWAGRTQDTRSPLVDFESLDGWSVVCDQAEAALAGSREQDRSDVTRRTRCCWLAAATSITSSRRPGRFKPTAPHWRKWREFGSQRRIAHKSEVLPGRGTAGGGAGDNGG